ncbi:MAG: hypothetical protein FWG20_07045, partial [Candidatus Cloacimonetes bacterium]|nr:hypothetical protein [Candidatus Cloacimonadota bacterium]
MPRPKKPSKTGNNPEIILCHKSKRFENIIVCTYQCYNRCSQYFDQFNIELIKKYIETHPEYEMKGVIMPASKVANTTKIPEKKKETSNEKIYWIITDENQYVEVTESEITSNPAEYIGKEMFEKP